jgi:translation initiation factor 3 subunit H
MASTSDYKEIKSVQVDALVILQIMKHCKQHSPQAVAGQLLGLDVDDSLQVTHAFGYVQKGSEEGGQQDDGEQYQLEMQKLLREVNVDANTIGWYQTTHLGQLFSNTVVDSQYLFQKEIPCSILLVYYPLQAAIGKASFKAMRFTKAFMDKHAEFQAANSLALNDFPASEMFTEVPLYIQSPAIVEAFLVDWSIMDAASTTQIDCLDTENQVFLERNLQLLTSALQDLAEEQQKLQAFERNAGRGEKGKGKGFRSQPPRALDTMILSQQIQNYCKQIDEFSSDSFGKLFLVANKPVGSQKK